MATIKTNAIQQLLKKARFCTLLSYLAMGFLLAVAIFILGEEIKHHVDAIEMWITNLGFWAVLMFMVLFVLMTSLLVPESILSIMAGALFGLRWGITVVVAGSLLAATLQYGISKNVLRKRIERAVASRPSLAAIQRAVGLNQLGLQALLRLTPLNPATISYMLGAVGVRFAGFLLACLAFIPQLLIEVYFGYAAKHAARMSGRSAPEVYVNDLIVFGGLAIAVIVMLIVSSKAHKAVVKAAS